MPETFVGRLQDLQLVKCHRASSMLLGRWHGRGAGRRRGQEIQMMADVLRLA
jgi:hypothetical protein